MSKTSLITIRIEPEVKSEAERLYSSFGLNLSDAVNMFIHQSLLVKGLPFELKNPTFKGEFDIEAGSSKETVLNLTIDEIKRIAAPIAKKYELKSLYLIGSRARGDNRPDSDYDFCFEISTNDDSPLKIGGLFNDLRDEFKNVDMIDLSAISKPFYDAINKEMVLIYEG